MPFTAAGLLASDGRQSTVTAGGGGGAHPGMHYEGGMLSLRHRLLATVAVLAALLLGCGSGDPAQPAPPAAADPVKWAGAYCSGVTAARDAALEQLTGPLTRADTAAQKEALLGYYDTAASEYRDSIRRLEQLGAPAVKAGRRHHQTALDLYRGLLGQVQQQREQLVALDPAAPEFEQRFAEIARGSFDRQSLKERTDAVSTDPQLGPVLRKAPACQQGRPGGGP